ncbi:MAG TPA: RAMP superfamily CRISPR-associated protein [Thermoanaerobaculia bacterium]|nr:RAMP superfamily CRISPR-associated protein [Thermoanaerobaculia bacterium]
MFRTLQNTAKLQFNLIPDGPIVVRAQSVGIDPGPADMEFQRTHKDGESTVFLAGSGLKGVIRSHCERLLRSSDRFACDPTQVSDPATCGSSRNRNPDPKQYPHDGNCPACFTFGSLKMAGRFRVSDAYPAPGKEEATNRTEVRAGVGIERRSQAASSGVLYDTEVVVGGGFETRVSGENFSLWQLGLVLAALQDLGRGLVRIGGGKARGMGSVKVEDLTVELGFLDSQTGKLTGARRTNHDTKEYGLPGTDVEDSPVAEETSSPGLFRLIRFQGTEEIGKLEKLLIGGPLRAYLGRR